MYIVTRLDCFKGEFEDLKDVMYLFFDFNINENNELLIRDKNYNDYVDKDYKQYSYSNEYTKEEIITDFCYRVLKDFSKRYFYKIYEVKQ